MDRFIGFYYENGCSIIPIDSINMDRFIGFYYENGCSIIPIDSINMDRFIVLQDMKKNI